MELQDFVKTKKTQKFLDTSYNRIYTKAEVLAEVQDVIEKWTINGESEKDVKQQVHYKVGTFEPYTKEFKETVQKRMKKWGLVN